MKHNYSHQSAKYLFCLLILFCLNIEIKSQNYTEKYNSTRSRYEYFDSRGNLIGYKKYNSISNRWEYTDLQNDSKRRRYSDPKSPYDWDFIERAMQQKQQAIDNNTNYIYEKIDEFNTAVDFVSQINGGLTKNQINEIKQFDRDLKKSTNGLDLSNNGSVRSVISWITSWITYVKSWSRNSKITYNNEDQEDIQISTNGVPNTIYLETNTILWDIPDISKGKRIGDVKGNVKILGKVVNNNFYKIEHNNTVGYIYRNFDSLSNSSNTVFFKNEATFWSYPDMAKAKKLGRVKGYVKMFGKVDNTNFYKIEFNGITGYVYGDYYK